METIADRIRLARKAKFRTATEAWRQCFKSHMAETTYLNHENANLRRNTKIAAETLDLMARAFDVSVEWLATGEGQMGNKRTIPIVGIVGADPSGQIIFASEQGELGRAPHVEGAHMVAVEVRGESMEPFADDHSLVYYSDRHDPPTADLIGHICVVGLADGRVLLKRLARASRRGTFDLLSLVGLPLHDQKVEWAAVVTDVKRASGRVRRK